MSHLTKRRKYKEVLEAGSGLIDFYLQNPCIAAYDLLGVDLAPIQRAIFEDFWFKNYVIAICSRGTGKSVHIDSLCHIKNKGLVYLSEELPPIPPYLKDGQEEIIARAEKVYTSEGFKNTKRLCLEKGIEGKKIVTQNRFEQKGSNHHPLLTLDSKCNFVYKSMDEFKPGDRVCIQRGQNVFGNNEVPIGDSYIIGLFVGDDSIDIKYTPSITTEDVSIKKFCIDYCIDNKVSYRVADDKRTKNTSSIIFKRFDWFFEKYKIGRTLSYYKSVPYSIRTATRESQIAFLQGYFDADGTAEIGRGVVSCCSVSKKLLIEIQIILLNFGIISRIRKKKTNSKFGKAYLLDISSEDAYKFKELIGFRLKRKQVILDGYFDVKKLNPNKDTVPYIRGLCWSIKQNYRKLNAKRYNGPSLPELFFDRANKKEVTYNILHGFVNSINNILNMGYVLDEVSLRGVRLLNDILHYNYYFDTVKSVEDWKGDCYDFEMEMGDEPNYFANGFINHNTFLLGLLATLSSMLKAGYRTGLISPVFRQSTVISDTYDTFWTSGGLQTTSQTFYDSVQEGVTKTQSLESQNTILSKWKNPERACRSIKTTKGFELAGTVDHGILVLDDKLDLVFKDLQDITENDNIVIKKGFKYFGNDNSMPTFDEFEMTRGMKDCKIPKKLTANLAYWAGIVIGDGCISISEKRNRTSRVRFINKDHELLNYFEKYLTDFLIYDGENISKTERKNGVYEIVYYSTKLCSFLLKCGMTMSGALKKVTPWVVKKASSECIKGFLQGLYDTEGCCYVRSTSKYRHCEVNFATSSLQLVKEVQAMLLNFNVMSSFSINSEAGERYLSCSNKISKCATSYRLRITGVPDLDEFRNNIGFRYKKKKDKLDLYLKLADASDRRIIPGASMIFLSLAESCKEAQLYENEDVQNLKSLINTLGNKKSISMKRINGILDIAEKYNVLTDDYYKLKKIIDLNLSFVKMIKSDYFFAPTIDVEVENESCYWSNGMISHNSKMIFAEVEKLYAQSSILRQACDKPPTRGSDVCYLRFKSIGGKTPSYIEALPLGADGSKIRGSRFYLLLIDELAQVPDKIIDLVLRPMGAVGLAPMERVRRLEQKARLISLGLALDTDFEEEDVNKMIMTSSGFYKFNHMWKRMKDHWSQEVLAEKEGVESSYKVWQVPYWDLPEGFLDTNNIEEAKRVMSSTEFRMEYEAEMVSDSEGFFKASLLETCSIDSGFTIEMRGDPTAQYIIGVDPNQGGRASCGIIIIRVGSVNKIVSVMELKTQTTQQLTQLIQDLCEKLNVLRIFMDKGGGGKAVCDLLEEGYGGKQPIIDRTNDDHRHLPGSHILELIYFNPNWIADANFTVKSMLEDKKLLFPEPPIGSTLDIEAANYTTINTLKSQMLNIIVTQTSTGILHFDTPQKGQKKDLYSALLLAAHGARTVEKELEGDGEPVLFNSSGYIRPHNQVGVGFNPITSQRGSSPGKSIIQAAVLKKKFN